MTPTLDTAMLYSSRVGSDLGHTSDWFEEFYLVQDITIFEFCDSVICSLSSNTESSPLKG